MDAMDGLCIGTLIMWLILFILKVVEDHENRMHFGKKGSHRRHFHRG